MGVTRRHRHLLRILRERAIGAAVGTAATAAVFVFGLHAAGARLDRLDAAERAAESAEARAVVAYFNARAAERHAAEQLRQARASQRLIDAGGWR